MESTRSSDSKFIPYRTRPCTFLLWEGVIRAYGNRILCLHRNPYVLTFYLGLGIGVIRPAFDISILFLFGYHMHLFGLLLNREIGLYIFHLIDFDIDFDTFQRIMQIEAIWCLTQAYMTDRSKYSKTPPLSYIPYITLDRYHIHGIRFTFKMPWWWNGRHARLKISCWRAWRFESSSRHNMENAHSMSIPRRSIPEIWAWRSPLSSEVLNHLPEKSRQ